jgi:hypothetical protein
MRSLPWTQTVPSGLGCIWTAPPPGDAAAAMRFGLACQDAKTYGLAVLSLVEQSAQVNMLQSGYG